MRLRVLGLLLAAVAAPGFAQETPAVSDTAPWPLDRPIPLVSGATLTVTRDDPALFDGVEVTGVPLAVTLSFALAEDAASQMVLSWKANPDSSKIVLDLGGLKVAPRAWINRFRDPRRPGRVPTPEVPVTAVLAQPLFAGFVEPDESSLSFLFDLPEGTAASDALLRLDLWIDGDLPLRVALGSAGAADRPQPFSHSTSPTPARWFSRRAMAKSVSESRLR